MKFSHQLKFNAVPAWRDHFIRYQALKRIVYDIQRLEAQADHELVDSEYGAAPLSEPLLQHSGSGRTHLPRQQQIEIKEEELVREMDRELAEIIAFFLRKEAETISQLESLDLEVHSLEKVRRMSTTASTHLGTVDESAILAVSEPLPSTGRTRRAASEDLGPISSPPLSSGITFQTPPAASGSASLTAGEATAITLPLPTTTTMQPAATSPAPIPEVDKRQLLRQSSTTPRPQRVRFWLDFPLRRDQREFRAERDKLRQRFVDVYTAIHDLLEFLNLNREGFRKLIKKHDKLTSSVSLKDTYWPLVEQKYPIKKKDELDANLKRLEDLFAIVFTGGEVQRAKDLLSRNLREHIKVERNTVWRDMVAMERKTVAATVEHTVSKEMWLTKYRSQLSLLVSVLAFAALLSVDIFPEPEKCNCLAILVFCSMLWATEAVPLFATALMIPVLVVTLRVLVDRTHPDAPERLTPQQAAPAIFHAMFSQVIMLLLGGFTIAAALSKHFIAKQMAVAVLSRVGRKPRNVLLASMFVATFASMWISNVAAPVLCFSLVSPILRTMDVTTPFAKALVMGIALASNVGGMTSPISSPQNIFAIERMSMDGHPPSWLAWFAVALPVAIITNFMCWGLLMAWYQPWTKTTEIRPLKPSNDPLTFTQVYVVVVSVATVGLWCANTALQKYTGEMGVVAVLPMLAFFGFGVLNKDDFNGFLWNVVMLAMGGSALGEAVKSSGLLLTIAEGIREVVDGLDLWTVTVIFCCAVLICTTFISHTVGAMVILPIVQSVGEAMPGVPHPKLLVMAAALMCSGAMGLPVSGFPNMNAVSLEDATGQTFVNTADFLAVGVPSSVLAYGVIISLGYVLMKAIGF